MSSLRVLIIAVLLTAAAVTGALLTPECEYEDASTNLVCYWDDGSGDPFIAWGFGHVVMYR